MSEAGPSSPPPAAAAVNKNNRYRKDKRKYNPSLRFISAETIALLQLGTRTTSTSKFSFKSFVAIPVELLYP